MRIFVVCLGLFFCLSFASSAFAISFDFTTPVNNFLFQTGNLSLQVDAYAVGAPDLDLVKVTRTADGLGVSSKPGDDGQLESSGPDDFLVFKFSQAVKLRQVFFSLVDADDKFTLEVDGLPALGATHIWQNKSVPLLDNVYLYDFDLPGSLFKIGSDLSAEKFRIKKMTVDLAPIPTPEPSTWFLLSSGVCGLVLWRKKCW